MDESVPKSSLLDGYRFPGWLISGSGVTAGRSAGFWKCGTLLSTNASDLGGEEGLHEGWQQRFAAFSRVVNELEKGEIERQVLLRNTAMGP